MPLQSIKDLHTRRQQLKLEQRFLRQGMRSQVDMAKLLARQAGMKYAALGAAGLISSLFLKDLIHKLEAEPLGQAVSELVGMAFSGQTNGNGEG